jgi:hypothetical protein
VDEVAIGNGFNPSLLEISPVESEMRTFALLTGLLFYGLVVGAGCSSSSSPPGQINGMTPAEYREKAELSRMAPAKTQKTGGVPR